MTTTITIAFELLSESESESPKIPNSNFRVYNTVCNSKPLHLLRSQIVTWEMCLAHFQIHILRKLFL